MSQALVGRVAVAAKQIGPGGALAVAVAAGQAVQIVDAHGGQVAEFVAFAGADHAEHLSPAATRAANNALMLQRGMRLLSNRRTPLFELVEDTVGRHDLLVALGAPPEVGTPANGNGSVTVETAAAGDGAGAASDTVPADVTSDAAPVDGESNGESEADEPVAPVDVLAEALAPFGIGADRLPDPVNWFGHVAIKGGGELEVRAPFSERNDHVVLLALVDTVVAVRAPTPAEGEGDDGRRRQILVRVFR